MLVSLPVLGAILAGLGASASSRWVDGTSGREIGICAVLGAASGYLASVTSALGAVEGIAATGLFSLLITTSLTEIHGNLIPNDLVLVALGVAAVPRLVTGSLIEGALGGGLLFGALLIYALVTNGLGLGAVKMAAAIGLLLGWQLAVAWALFALITFLAIAGFFRFIHWRRESLPSSPVLLTGLAVAKLIGPYLIQLVS